MTSSNQSSSWIARKAQGVGVAMRATRDKGCLRAVDGGASVVLLVSLAGCGAVLSKPQAAAIQDFAQASDTFVKLPSAVLRSYEEVHLETRMFDTTTVGERDASRAVTQLMRAIAFSQELEKLAVKLDATTDVLSQYAALLRKLSSNMSGGVAEAASDLGGALDESIGSYNQVLGGKAPSLPPVGSAAASAARAVGGLYVKHQQLAYLREFVGRADPLVTRLTSDVDILVSTFLGAEGYLGADATSIQNTLAAYASSHGIALSVADVHFFGETLRKEALAVGLAEKVRDISTKLAKAHSALKVALAPRPSLVSARAELQVLIKELQAAAQVKAKLDGTKKCTIQ